MLACPTPCLLRPFSREMRTTAASTFALSSGVLLPRDAGARPLRRLTDLAGGGFGAALRGAALPLALVAVVRGDESYKFEVNQLGGLRERGGGSSLSLKRVRDLAIVLVLARAGTRQIWRRRSGEGRGEPDEAVTRGGPARTLFDPV